MGFEIKLCFSAGEGGVGFAAIKLYGGNFPGVKLSLRGEFCFMEFFSVTRESYFGWDYSGFP